MTASGPIGSNAEPMSERETVIARAKATAHSRHDLCNDIDLQAAGSDVSGDNLVYCGRCGQLLLRWGGSDE